MESIEERKIVMPNKEAARESALTAWLSGPCGLSSFVLQPLVQDASLRRYFRVQTEAGSWVVMDAPPPEENGRPFIAIANALRAMSLHTPEIIKADVEQGFLLLTDFGDLTYLKALSTDNADTLYRAALNALAALQSCREVAHHTVPTFTAELMWQEWAWHKEWFLRQWLGLSYADCEKELDACYHLLVEAATTQPQVFMHRDYHSANLMVLPDQAVGILDFQDAFIGPVTYDVVSLLRDCYIAWPPERVKLWAMAYWQLLNERGVLREVEFATFFRWVDGMGIQRHLKALFTFARKHVRDHQSHYLHHVPRTLCYVQQVSAAYPELAALHDYVSKAVVLAAERKMSTLCVA